MYSFIYLSKASPNAQHRDIVLVRLKVVGAVCMSVSGWVGSVVVGCVVSSTYSTIIMFFLKLILITTTVTSMIVSHLHF